MTKSRDTQHARARAHRKNRAVESTFLAATAALDACLETLNTADKNRLLLALHAQIGEQLDSLAANNDQ